MEFKNNTYSKTVKADVTDRLEIEIGDSKQADFFPQLKAMRWDNEVNLSIRLKDDSETKATVKEKDGVITHTKDGKTCRFYDHTDTELHPEGAYEFDVVLDSKPGSNVVEFTIETKGLDFFYQGELTEDEIAEGCERPENVIGSYAVYHSEKSGNHIGGKNYGCGKAFHIYRPEIYDSNGSKVWGELNVENNLLTVTIPQDFLDTATYPITIDPTFGYATTGGSTYEAQENNIVFGSKFLSAASATIDSISVYCRDYNAADHIKMVIYEAKPEGTASPIITNGLAPAIALPSGSAYSARTSTYVSKPSIANGTNYYLAFHFENAYTETKYDTGSSGVGFDSYSSTYAAVANLEDYPYYTTIKFTVYATYTEGGAATSLKDIIGCGIIPFAR
jgi:hypothetical protein